MASNVLISFQQCDRRHFFWSWWFRLPLKNWKFSNDGIGQTIKGFHIKKWVVFLIFFSFWLGLEHTFLFLSIFLLFYLSIFCIFLSLYCLSLFFTVNLFPVSLFLLAIVEKSKPFELMKSTVDRAVGGWRACDRSSQQLIIWSTKSSDRRIEWELLAGERTSPWMNGSSVAAEVKQEEKKKQIKDTGPHISLLCSWKLQQQRHPVSGGTCLALTNK